MNKIKCKKGEAYIDICVGILILMIILAFSINVYQFFVIRQELDEAAEQIIETATYSGCFGDKVEERHEKLQEDIYPFELEVSAPEYYNETHGQVQLGDLMEITVSKDTYLQALGKIKIPMRVSVHKSGISERYWKEEVEDIEYEDDETEEIISPDTP